MKWYGERAKASARRGAVRGMRAWAQDVFAESQRLVPVDTKDPRGGRLRDSGTLEFDEAGMRATIHYSGEHRKADGASSGPTAVFVHEDLTAQHGPGKQAKYLERPLNDSRRTGPERVRREIARELR